MSSMVAKQRPRGVQAVLAVLVSRRVPLSIALFGALLAADLLSGQRPHDPWNYGDWHAAVGTLLAVCGMLLRSWAAGTLHKWHELTTVGPYRLMRNPLYAGSFMLMIGFCLLIGQWQHVLLVAGPIIVLYVLKVRDEERTLSAKFGPAWQDYAAATPRFLPRRLPLRLGGQWQFSQWMKNQEYQAAAATLAGLFALQLWHSGLIGG